MSVGHVDNHVVSVDIKLGRATAIREALLLQVDSHPGDLISFVASEFHVSRQAVHRLTRQLIEAGELSVEGDRRHARYRKAFAVERSEFLAITPQLEEDRLWDRFARPALEDLRPNVLAICGHGFTEMVNNVVDHSGGRQISLKLERTLKEVKLIVADDGVGIFEKIKKECGLESPEQAIFELSKGKLTTDPARHSGEGIFFTSRVFDRFSILSGGLWFGHTREEADWLLNDFKERSHGTFVFMGIAVNSEHTTQEAFDAYSTTRDGMSFDRTVVALDLAKTGPLVSRSQAKRVVSRLNRFKEAVLDFADVPAIGQAFADEIFRVYKTANPGLSLKAINANEAVQRMIRRAETAEQRDDVRGSSLGSILRDLIADPEFSALADDQQWATFRTAVARVEPSRAARFDSVPSGLRRDALRTLLELAGEKD